MHLEQCFKLIFFPRCRLKSVHLLPVKSATPHLWSTSSSGVNCEARRIGNIWSGLSRSFYLLSFVYWSYVAILILHLVFWWKCRLHRKYSFEEKPICSFFLQIFGCWEGAEIWSPMYNNFVHLVVKMMVLVFVSWTKWKRESDEIEILYCICQFLNWCLCFWDSLMYYSVIRRLPFFIFEDLLSCSFLLCKFLLSYISNNH
jgi:hypothetical protein